METTQEKISLLQEMISFALIDGELHDKEYDFIEIVAYELQIDKATLLKLYENKGEVKVIKDEMNRICQFYRLALLMHCDGVLHDAEQIKINEIVSTDPIITGKSKVFNAETISFPKPFHPKIYSTNTAPANNEANQPETAVTTGFNEFFNT